MEEGGKRAHKGCLLYTTGLRYLEVAAVLTWVFCQVREYFTTAYYTSTSG
jgi:hypothetical protein